MIEHEKAQELARLQRNVDPFQDRLSPEGEKKPAPGLNQFYMQLAVPDIDTVRGVTSDLLARPYEDIRALRSFIFFYPPSIEIPAGQAVNVKDAEKLHEGWRNADTLIDRVASQFDYETKLPSEYADLDTLPQQVLDEMQIRGVERDLSSTADLVKSEPDLNKRKRLALKLKRKALEYIDRFKVTYYKLHLDYDDDPEKSKGPEVPTWKTLTGYFGWETQTPSNTTIGYTSIKQAVETAHASIKRHDLAKKLESTPPVDRERYQSFRLKFGAKAAGLMMLSETTPAINKLRGYSLDKLAVPEFQAVPVDLYKAWKEGQEIDKDLKPYFDWATDLKEDRKWYTGDMERANYMVRSSAVYSEDGEELTGAGIYDSVFVRAGSSFEDFKQAVVKVFESTDSPQAQSYRKQHGIEHEEMGLVIQKYVSPHTSRLQGLNGYVNSSLPGVPALMEIRSETSRNFIKRDELEFYLGLNPDSHEKAFKHAHHFQPDLYQADPHTLIRVAHMVGLVEKVWGRDIQVEYVVDGSNFNFVQIRDLPPKLFDDAPIIEFPDITHAHGGAAIGIGDIELRILDSYSDNSNNVGAVVYMSSYMWTYEGNPDYLPKEGAVILTGDGEANGHIQTLCAEKGLICIFPDPNEDESQPRLWIDDFHRLKKIRIVSNGIEGRVYKLERENIHD